MKFGRGGCYLVQEGGKGKGIKHLSFGVHRVIRTHTPPFVPLPNFVIYPLCFLTPYKSCDILPALARTSD